MPVENETLVSRWSRRKQLVAEEAALEQKIASGEIVDAELIVDPETLREEKLAELNALTDEDMPDLETLGEDSDYTGFMSVNVSEGLRKMALKKLFHSKTYNIRDGLDEYDGDYTFFEKLDPLTITSDMKHMIEVEARRALEKEQQEEEQRLLAEATELENNDYAIDDGIEEEWDDDFADDVEDEIEETSTLITKSEIEDINSDNEGVA